MSCTNRGSIAAKSADGVAGVGDVGGDGGVVGSVASSLAPPSSWQKLDRLVFSLTTVTSRRGGTAGGGGGGGGGDQRSDCLFEASQAKGLLLIFKSSPISSEVSLR